MKKCPHCCAEIMLKELPHQGFFDSYRICPKCDGFFTADTDTKYRQALLIVIMLISLVFTIFLYFGDGSSSGLQNPSHSYSAGGTYTVNLTVTDNDGDSDTVSQSVTVSEPATVHVGDLEGSVRGKKNWKATIFITAHYSNESAVVGALVSGSWSNGGSASCLTNTNGECTVEQRTKENNLTFTVSNISADSNYDAGENHDIDGDTDGTSITINRNGSVF